MNQSLGRLIYVSRNAIKGDELTVHHEITNILKLARDSNRAAGITGALMFNLGSFAQVLEGDLVQLEDTFERIQCDSRHTKVVLLSFDEVEQRGFDSWSMAYVGENLDALEEFKQISTDSGFDSDRFPADRIYELLKHHLLQAEGAVRPQHAA